MVEAEKRHIKGSLEDSTVLMLSEAPKLEIDFKAPNDLPITVDTQKLYIEFGLLFQNALFAPGEEQPRRIWTETSVTNSGKNVGTILHYKRNYWIRFASS